MEEGGGSTAARPPESAAARYRRFWNEVGESFPDLGGAVSTRFYLESEQRLLREFLPLRGDLLKTDLWDECKNTRILQWAAQQGARPYGVDLSEPIARRARAGFPRGELRGVVSDVRRLPFREASFDAIYSMGTIEHFRDPETAVAEMFRVLRPAGRAIVGVPNRLDPFLRPLVVAALYRFGLYGYGYERSFTRRALRRLLQAAGFRAVAETGILFLPGWLRMLELFCRQRRPAFAGLAGAAMQPFAFLERRVAFVRRYGYLIVCVVEKPAPANPPLDISPGTPRAVSCAGGCRRQSGDTAYRRTAIREAAAPRAPRPAAGGEEVEAVDRRRGDWPGIGWLEVAERAPSSACRSISSRPVAAWRPRLTTGRPTSASSRRELMPYGTLDPPTRSTRSGPGRWRSGTSASRPDSAPR
jgi:SAM-dependent methyltransferase